MALILNILQVSVFDTVDSLFEFICKLIFFAKYSYNLIFAFYEFIFVSQKSSNFIKILLIVLQQSNKSVFTERD